tara:strand:- start:234 stop:452 length:219 start_codon:yes stop_codon:yes gene_type:complete
MNDQDSYDLAEQLIDESIFRVSTGANQEEEIDMLMKEPVVQINFEKEELESIFQFELQDHRMYTNLTNREIH